jgi:hypothetical protein
MIFIPISCFKVLKACRVISDIFVYAAGFLVHKCHCREPLLQNANLMLRSKETDLKLFGMTSLGFLSFILNQTAEVTENTVLHSKENRLAYQRTAHVRLHGSVMDGRNVRKKAHRNSKHDPSAVYLASVHLVHQKTVGFPRHSTLLALVPSKFN